MTFCFVQLYHITERGGGAELQAHYLSQELSNRGFIVHYICKTISKEKENTSEVKNGVVVHWLPQKGSLSIRNLALIRKKLIKIKPDFIIERMSSTFGLSILLAKRKLQTSYIWVCTDNLSPRLFKFVQNGFQKTSIVKFLVNLPKYIISDFIRFLTIKRADIVLAQNDFQNYLISKNFNRISKRIVSGHPIPHRPLSKEARFRKKTILWCGNFGKHKRPEIFVELARQFKSENLRFIMVGGHSDKEYLQSILIKKPQNLYTTGHLNFEEAENRFDEATILINSSISEGFSNTYIQAWLRGIPTIVFGADPNNIIKSNELGFNVKSIEEASISIKMLLNDFYEYKNMSERVAEYATKNHSIKIMTNKFLEEISFEDNPLFK